MICRKCQKSLPEDALFCPYCGIKQTIAAPKKRTRGNGQGSVYKLPNGKYRAAVVLGYENGRCKRRTKSGFKTKKEALEYLPKLFEIVPGINPNIRFKELYDQWLPLHESKVSKSTIDCYKSAVKYYEPIYFAKFADLKTDHLQKCVSECPKGRRTKENMKALGTLLYKYAMQQDLVDKNYAQFVYLGHSEKSERKSFSPEEIEVIINAAGTVPYAEYILVLIYTGFRINEFLNLQKKHYHPKEQYLIGGSKTEAGKNRVVTLSPKIQPIIKRAAANKSDEDYLFTGEGQSKISDSVFREKYYYPTLEALRISKLPPHSCRHTFATLMKQVDAPDVDKQKLIGHTSFEMTAHYTHTNYHDLKKITDKL